MQDSFALPSQILRLASELPPIAKNSSSSQNYIATFLTEIDIFPLHRDTMTILREAELEHILVLLKAKEPIIE